MGTFFGLREHYRAKTNALRGTAADWLSRPMFVLSLIFLSLIAALIVVWVDIPRVNLIAGGGANAVVHGDQAESFVEHAAQRLGEYLLIALMLIWPVFWIEFLFKLFTRDPAQPLGRRQFIQFLNCICPPLRMAAACSEKDDEVWLPVVGWQVPNKQLYRRLERGFSKPMLLIALAILPVLLIEFGLQGYVEQYTWLRLTLHVGTGLIWCAFALEFIIMFSVTDKKLRYVKQHWIDLAIIVLPLVSFLRSLRVIRAVKVAKFAKMQQLAKMSRVYRMRGLIAKTFRALMLLEIVNRLLRVTPEKKLSRLKADYAEKRAELGEIQAKIKKIQAQIILANFNQDVAM